MADSTYVFQILGAAPGLGGNTALTADDLAAVRGALGITDSEVPDELVHENSHAARAEMQVIQEFPLAASQTAEDLIQVITVCRLLTASHIAAHMEARIAKQERIEGAVNTVNFHVDWPAVSESLRVAAYELLYTVQAYVDQVLGSGTATADIPGFPIARANGLSRDQIRRNAYAGFVVK